MRIGLLLLVGIMIVSTAWAFYDSWRIDQAAERHVSRRSLRRLEAHGVIPPATGAGTRDAWLNVTPWSHTHDNADGPSDPRQHQVPASRTGGSRLVGTALYDQDRHR